MNYKVGNETYHLKSDMGFENVRKCAQEIFNYFDGFRKSNQIVKSILKIHGKLQSGKTTLIKVLSEGFEKIFENFTLVTTTYALKDITEQLEADIKSMRSKKIYDVDFKKLSELTKICLKQNILVRDNFTNDIYGIFIIDESEFGIGKESQLEKILSNLLKENLNIKVMFVFVGASNVSLTYVEGLQSKGKELNTDIPVVSFALEPGEGYFGVEEIARMRGKYHIDVDIKESGKFKNKKYTLGKNALRCIDDVVKSSTQNISIIRAAGRKGSGALQHQKQLKKIYSNSNVEVRIISEEECGTGNLKPTFEKLMYRALRQWEREKDYNLILIVLNSLSAGYRIDSNIKPLVGFILENTKVTVSAIQGLIGRMCGYWKPKNLKVMCNFKMIEEFLHFQDCIREGVPYAPKHHPKASTQTRGKTRPKPIVSGGYRGTHTINESLPILDKKRSAALRRIVGRYCKVAEKSVMTSSNNRFYKNAKIKIEKNEAITNVAPFMHTTQIDNKTTIDKKIIALFSKEEKKVILLNVKSNKVKYKDDHSSVESNSLYQDFSKGNTI